MYASSPVDCVRNEREDDDGNVGVPDPLFHPVFGSPSRERPDEEKEQRAAASPSSSATPPSASVYFDGEGNKRPEKKRANKLSSRLVGSKQF